MMWAVTLDGVRIPLAALVLEFIKMFSKLRKESVLEPYSCLSRWPISVGSLDLTCNLMLSCTCGSSEVYATYKSVDFETRFCGQFNRSISDSCCVPGASASFVKDHQILVCDNRKCGAGKDISHILILFVMPLCFMNAATSCHSDTVHCHAGHQCVTRC